MQNLIDFAQITAVAELIEKGNQQEATLCISSQRTGKATVTSMHNLEIKFTKRRK